MNPLIDSLTQDYILLNIEMIKLLVTGSNTKHILVGLYYAKESKRILEPQEHKILIPVTNNDKGTFAYDGFQELNDFTQESFTELLKDTIKKTDPEIEDEAFNFSITQSNIQNAYYSFKNKIDDITRLQETHLNLIYDYAMVNWKKRKYIMIHLPDTRLDFKYEFGLYPGNLTVYDTHTNRYIFEDHIDSLNVIFNTDYIKSHFYSEAFDLRSYESGIKDFQRFQYLMLELLIQDQLRLSGSDNKFEETFLINNDTAVTYYLDKSNSTFCTNLFFNADDIFSNRTLTLIKHQVTSETIIHDISHIDIISRDYEQEEYKLTDNNLFLQEDEADNTIKYNTAKLFEFMINRLTRCYFSNERTFMEDKPNKKNLIDTIPLIME